MKNKSSILKRIEKLEKKLCCKKQMQYLIEDINQEFDALKSSLYFHHCLPRTDVKDKLAQVDVLANKLFGHKV